MAKKLPKEINILIDELTDNDHESVKSSSKLQFGKLFLWAYSAKYASRLDVWDKLPLVIFLGFDGKLIHGINLHYIPFLKRIQFMKMLQGQGNKIKYKDIKKAWQSAKLPVAYARLAYRCYLPSHIQSNIKIFEDHEDQMRIVKNVLPIFEKKSRTQVARDIEKALSKQRKNIKSKK